MRTPIDKHQRDQLLALEEGHFQELKAMLIKPASLSKSVSAFANASGGEIYVGISEEKVGTIKTRHWEGFGDMEDANGIFQMLAQVAPLSDFITTTFLSCEGERGLVLKIEIFRNGTIIKATDGVPYLRKGAQKLPVDTNEAMERLKLDKGISSYEDYKVQGEIAFIENSAVLLEFLLGVVPTAEPEPWLRKQRFIVDQNPTVAGVLLFAEEPQSLLPKRTAIKIFRYKTSDPAPAREHLVFDPLTIEGCAYRVIYAAVAKTQEIIEELKHLGADELLGVQYPVETLHEIITNAVLHRDYSVATDIQIRIFDNRIEVESPGRLAGHVTTENILHTQFARNQRLVRMINKFPNPPNKDVGEGLNTAFDAMRRLRLREPSIQESAHAVTVIIPHERLASPEELVLDFLRANPEITNRQARELCGARSENSMKSTFKRLEARGLIEQVPDRTRFKAAWRQKGG